MKIKNFKHFLAEQASVPTLMTILANPALIGIFGKDNSNTLYLAQRDAKGKVVPGTTHTYSVKGEYGFFGFDVALRKAHRAANGDLWAEASPKSSIIKKLLSLIPKENLTPDGWIKVMVPNAKVTTAIRQLQQSQGKSAEMDAGQGVTISIEKSS